MGKIIAFFLYSFCLLADPWKGDEYAKHSKSQQLSAEDFLQGADFNGVERILDVGCGDGKITAAMALAIGDGQVIGIDISPSMIEAAKKTFSLQENVSFLVADAADLPFDQSFDLITSFTVMQWVLDQEKALRGFANLLNEKGKLWIQMPTGLPKDMQIALDTVVAKDQWKEYFVEFIPPWRFYQLEEYKKLLEKVALTPTRLSIVTKHEKFPSRVAFQGFLQQWFPYLRPLPVDKKGEFLTDLLHEYIARIPLDVEGRVSFIVDRLEVEATK